MFTILIQVILFFWMLLIGFLQAHAQRSTHPDATNCDGDYCWGDFREEGKVQFAMYSDTYVFGEKYWADVVEPLDWLLENIPFLNIGMYINGYKMLDYVEKNEKDPEKKKMYQDRILTLLDKRITYFGDEAENLQRKGLKAYPFLAVRGKAHFDSLYSLYNRIIELNGDKTYLANVLYYMAMVKIKKQFNQLTDDQVLEAHDRAIQIIDRQMAATTSATEQQEWKDAANQVDDMVSKIVSFDCDKIRERIGKDLQASPNDFQVTKRALRYLIQGKCTDDPLFLVAAVGVFQHEPSANLATAISKRYVVGQDYTNALAWYDKAIGLAGKDQHMVASLMYDKAQVLAVQGKKQEARAILLKSLELSTAQAAKTYALVGDMYMTSAGACPDPSPVKARAIYLAAYDMYAKAGDQSKMAQAKAQFPSIEEIFTAGLTEGASIDVGCWIGGTTTLRRR